MEEAGDALAMKEKVKELENQLAGMAELRQQMAQMQRMLMTKNSQVKSVMNISRNVMINHALNYIYEKVFILLVVATKFFG